MVNVSTNNCPNFRPDCTEQIKQLLKQRILVLDGAMGTMVQQQYLQEEDFRGELYADWPVLLRGNNDLLTLTQPALISSIYKAYLKAGADILETNTFNATQTSMADYDLEEAAYDINFHAARLAREACDEFSTSDKPRFVAGVLGPTAKTTSMSPDVNDPGYRAITFDQLKDDYYQSTKGLLAGGADIILVETVFDTLNAKAALFAIQTLFEDLNRKVPVMVSGTITDASGRTLSGQTTEAFYASIAHVEPLAVGLNCALGPDMLRPYVQTLAEMADCFVSVHPNAGLPNEFGEYDLTPSQMAEQMGEWIDSGWVNIIGGCCGTTPKHIEAIANASLGKAPRIPQKKSPEMRLSGLEVFKL